MTSTMDDVDVQAGVADEAPAAFDLSKVEAFGEKMMSILDLGTTANMMSIGHHVGLVDAMAGLGRRATSQQIAAAAGLNERYVRERSAESVQR